MRHPSSMLLAVAATVFALACADGSSTAPQTSSGSAAAPGDSGSVAPSSVGLSGHVFAIQANPAAMGSDTLQFVPIAGVGLTLMHNILVNGVATQELAGTTVSDASGAYKFDGIAGGYYVLYAHPSAASGYDGSYSLVPAQSAQVRVDVFVWKKP